MKYFCCPRQQTWSEEYSVQRSIDPTPNAENLLVSFVSRPTAADRSVTELLLIYGPISREGKKWTG